MARINRLDTREAWERLENLRSLAKDVESAIDERADAIKAAVEAPDDEALADAVEDAEEAVTEAEEAFRDAEADNVSDGWGTLEELEALADEVGGLNLRDGLEMIDESDFEDYARELADDVCEIPNSWPCTCIDWEQAAKELRSDYSEVEFAGTTYLWK